MIKLIFNSAINNKVKSMKKTLSFIALPCLLLFTSAELLAQTSYPGMPAEIAAELEDIGPIIEVRRTTALYAPYFSQDDYADKNINRNVAYGSHERHVLDIFTTVDTSSDKPVLIFVHGGGFAGGAKSSPDSPFYDNIMNWAVEEGMIGLSINYRLAPEHQWPAGIEDLTRMLAWVTDNISAYGGDPSKIFLWGHSAGAAHVGDYLAWQANHNLEDSVAGAILTSGFYILGDEVSIWKSYYGEDLSTYAERSSLPGLLKTTTPLLANDAELDSDRFKADTIALTAAFKEAGKALTRVHLKGHSHLSETYAVGSEDESLSGPVLEFIRGVSE